MLLCKMYPPQWLDIYTVKGIGYLSVGQSDRDLVAIILEVKGLEVPKHVGEGDAVGGHEGFLEILSLIVQH